MLLLLMASTGAFYRLEVATFVWVALYACTIAYILRFPLRWFDAVAFSWPLLAFPLFSLLSVLWSAAPDETSRHGLQYLFTFFIAVLIGCRFRVRHLLALLCGATLLSILASVVSTYFGWIEGYYIGDYPGAEAYFVGLYPQKNMMGIVIALAAISILTVGLIYEQKVLALVAAAGLGLVAWEAKSTTAILLYCSAFLTYPLWWIAQRSVRTTVSLLSLMVIASGAAVAVLALQIPVVDSTLAGLGKEATLTGRTVIWETGLEVAQNQPFLGVGYQAFWEAPRFSNAVSVVHAAVLDTIQGFHNSYLETFVATGLIGVLLYVLMLGTALFVALRTYTYWGEKEAFAAIAVICMVIARTFTESVGYFQHDIEFVLVTALAVSLTHHPTGESGWASWDLKADIAPRYST